MFRNYIWSLCIITRRMLDDHLENGKYFNPSQQLIKKTVSVSTTNSIAERNFGMLDRFIKEKPNANMITYVSIIINRTNKIPELRKKLIPEKRSLMMKWARESVSKQYQDFKQRRMEIRKAKNEKRLDKIEEARKKESRTRLMKEKFCAEISKYGGLWLPEEQIDAKLAEVETDSKKVISMFPSDDKKLFYLSEKSQAKSVKELTENLKTLFETIKK